MTLDQKLSWKSHVEQIINKCEGKINILNSVCNCWWGSDIATALMIYRAIIRPHFDYGSSLFGNSPKYIINKLERIQIRSLRICTGAIKSTPTNSLLVECCEMPMRGRFEMISSRYISRKISMSDSLVLNAIRMNTTNDHQANHYTNRNMLLSSLESITNETYQIYRSPSHIYFSGNFRSYFRRISFHIFIHKKGTPFINLIFKNFIATDFTNHTIIYTDGSKSNLFIYLFIYFNGTRPFYKFLVHI